MISVSETIKHQHAKALELHHKLRPLMDAILEAHEDTANYSDNERGVVDAFMVNAIMVIDLHKAIYDAESLEDHIVQLDKEIESI